MTGSSHIPTAGTPGETGHGDGYSADSCNSTGPVSLLGALVRVVDDAARVEIDSRGGQRPRMSGHTGVLADGQSDSPTCDIDDDRPGSGAEDTRLVITEMAFPVGDADCLAVHPEGCDVVLIATYDGRSD